MSKGHAMSLLIAVAVSGLIVIFSSYGMLNVDNLFNYNNNVAQSNTEKSSSEEELMAKDYSGSKDTVEGLTGISILEEKRKMSKTIENNGKASGLNGLELD
jgi:hypothetical protein